MNSITAGRSRHIRKKNRIRLWAAVVWLAVWEAASRAIGHEILLASPITVVLRLFEIGATAAFWHAIVFSFFRIACGFAMGVLSGVLLAALGGKFLRVRELLAPFMLTVKATPVASFIILALIWVSTKNLSVLTTLLMVLPVIYTNVLDGIFATDPALLEAARVFRIPAGRALRYIYVSQVLPYFRSACSVALAMSWKAGVAAEIIGVPDGSIGEKLYKAKIYLQTPDVFAWTLVIILISFLFEKIFLWLLDRLVGRLERM